MKPLTTTLLSSHFFVNSSLRVVSPDYLPVRINQWIINNITKEGFKCYVQQATQHAQTLEVFETILM